MPKNSTNIQEISRIEDELFNEIDSKKKDQDYQEDFQDVDELEPVINTPNITEKFDISSLMSLDNIMVFIIIILLLLPEVNKLLDDIGIHLYGTNLIIFKALLGAIIYYIIKTQIISTY